MDGVRGIVVCVGYDDLLAVTLPRNARHMVEVVVVTAPGDAGTLAVTASVANARPFVTDAFARHGARFNKGLALEEGFDVLGRSGWILIHDADTLLPDAADFGPARTPGVLYGARRRLLEDPRRWRPDLDWGRLPFAGDRPGQFPGYFQLFHAADPAVAARPWYDVTFGHAGGGDGYFDTRWPAARKALVGFDVLHLGPRDTNWFGRASLRADGTQPDGWQERAQLMHRYATAKGWRSRRGAPGPVPEPEFSPRVDVPGYGRSGFDVRGRS